MNGSNPYETSSEQAAAGCPHPVVMFWAMGVVFVSVIIAGITGAILGGVIGWALPSYYQSVFANGGSLTFDPIAVGIGQGLTQGVVLGALIGIALVAIYAWLRSRTKVKSV